MPNQLKIFCTLSIFTLLITIGKSGIADANIVVDDDSVQCPNASYSDLQEAVNSAQPGETLEVCPGTYAGTITIGAAKSGLTLLGQKLPMAERVGDPTQEAVLAGSPLGRPGFAVQADDVAIINFTIVDTGDTGIEVKPADGVTPVSGVWLEANRLDSVGDPDNDGDTCAGGRAPVGVTYV